MDHKPALHGFTLIEMLVVISIIALLIAVLLPALKSARVAAQATKSVTQAKQITYSLFLYAEDYRTSLPFSRDAKPTQSTGTYWGGHVFHKGYLTNISIFWGPRRVINSLSPTNMRNSANHFHWRHTGYSANYNGAMPQEDWGYPPLKLNRPGNPSASYHLLLTEAFRSDHFFNNTFNPANADGNAGSSIGTPTQLLSYAGRVVRTYMDGHGAIRDGADVGWNATGERTGTWSGSNMHRPWYDIRFPSNWN